PPVESSDLVLESLSHLLQNPHLYSRSDWRTHRFSHFNFGYHKTSLNYCRSRRERRYAHRRCRPAPGNFVLIHTLISYFHQLIDRTAVLTISCVSDRNSYSSDSTGSYFMCKAINRGLQTGLHLQNHFWSDSMQN